MIDAYYQGHKSLKGMFAVDAGDTQGVGQVIQKYKLQGKVKGGGYDLLPGTLKLIQNGSLQFTIDQQPYLQGFYPVVQLFLQKAVRWARRPVGHEHGPAVRHEGQRQAVPEHQDPVPRELEGSQVPGLVTLEHHGGRSDRGERRAGFGWRVAGWFVRRREASIFVVAVLLCVYFSLESAAFYSSDNLKNITETMAPIALIAAGQAMLLICGEIDLALGRVYALAPAIVYVVSSEDAARPARSGSG